MKVLQINSVCGTGSTGRIATDLYNELMENGHECVIAYGRGTCSPKFRTIKIGNHMNNIIHGIQTRLLDNHGFSSVKETKVFLEEIDRFNPDIIHLHNIHGYYINIELLFKYLKQANKPVIWTLHDAWAFTGHCAYFDFAKCNKWKVECKECPQKSSYPASFIDNSKSNYTRKKNLFNGVDSLTVITPSVWLAELVKESFLSDYPTKVINNGIDLEVFKPKRSDILKRYGVEGNYIILGVASVWEKRKGLEDFIKLSEKLHENDRIILVGVSKKQQRLLPANIIGIPRTNNVQELVELYSAADIMINPTYEDNFPTTNLESLACGTPVITYRTGGSPESISDKCGYIADKGDLVQILNFINSNKITAIEEKACIEQASKYNKKTRFREYLDYMELECLQKESRNIRK